MANAATYTGGTVSVGSGSGSITINDTVEGETYYIYKLCDVEYNQSLTSYSYTIQSTDPWYSFFTTVATDYVSVSTNGTITWTAGGTNTESLARAFATLALQYAADNPSTVADSLVDVEADSTGTISVQGLELGYYLVDSTIGSLCTLTTTQPSAEINDKNPEPTVVKEVYEDSTESWGDENTADIGEVVQFKIEIQNAYDVYNLTLHDVLGEGLTLIQNTTDYPITVRLGSSLANADNIVASSNYTIFYNCSDGCDFEIVFDDDYIDSMSSSQNLFVYYYATVNSSAVIADTGNPNTAHFIYGDASVSTTDNTITYVYDLYVYKYTAASQGADPKTALAEASFVIYKSVNGTNYYAYLDSDYKVVAWTPYKTYDDWYAASQAGTATSDYYATTLTTGTDGFVHFIGLDAGSYYLEETVAPDGYNLLAAAVDVEIAQDGTISGAETVTGTTITAIQVYNGSSEVMPSTGGIGTTIFYVVGGVLVIGAVILLITKKRMKSDDKV